MSEENVPSQPPLSEEPTLLRHVKLDDLFVRAMQPVKMTSGASGTWQPPGIDECAQLFPGYEVLRLLGRGGMGAVYQARQIELDRLVAIKLLPLEVSVDRDFADRFRREARAMARLNHPNIVTVHDFGATGSGHLFFVMEFVEGANLAAIIRQARLDAGQALSIVEQVCTALAYAHHKGIVHRDVKPANVLIDTEGNVKVADFGLARLTDPGSEQLGHTVTGAIMGTPEYMAPEQTQGMNVDHRADIYSVGVMLYEMLCREIPKGIFDPPSHRTGCDVRVDQIVIKAMQQTPGRRYQSTHEMRMDIAAARQGVIVPTAAAGTPRRSIQNEVLANQLTQVPILPTPAPPKAPAASASVPPPYAPSAPVRTLPVRPPPVGTLPTGTVPSRSSPPDAETAVTQVLFPPPTPTPAPAKPRSSLVLGIAASVMVICAVIGILCLQKASSPGSSATHPPVGAGAPHGDAVPGSSPGTAKSTEPGTANSPGTPANPDVPNGSALPTSATMDAPFVNSLGMKFVPVPLFGGSGDGLQVLFSVWDTRVQDFEEFVRETKREWPKPDFDQGPAHPAVYVSWEDAELFCHWLTKHERAAGRLPADWNYRLPRDFEWSCAVGLGDREDPAKLPSEKNGKITDAFPWGPQWPPPENAGNYAGEELRPPGAAGPKSDPNSVIVGYRDGYAHTSPVGTFTPNQYGLYDMGGNVWQWCGDWYDRDQKEVVLRGASWEDRDRGTLLSSYRSHLAPTVRYLDNRGFRCVLAPVARAEAPSAAPPLSQGAPGGSVPPGPPAKDTP